MAFQPTSPPFPQKPHSEYRDPLSHEYHEQPDEHGKKRFKSPPITSATTLHAKKQCKNPPTTWRSFDQRRAKKHTVAEFTRATKITIHSPPVIAPKIIDPDLLSERQRPHALDDLIGQPVTEIRKWIDDKNNKVPGTAPALLLVGPCGTGKSTAAHLTCQAFGKVYSFGVEDTYQSKCVLSKSGITNAIFPLAIRKTVFERFAILIDDVASIHCDVQKVLASVVSGEYCVQQFHSSRRHCPFVFTCDSGSLECISDVSKHCKIVYFVEPSHSDMLAFCAQVCTKENLPLTSSEQGHTVKCSGGDFRRLLNSLQWIAVNYRGGVPDISRMYQHQTNSLDLITMIVKNIRDGLESLGPLIEQHPVALEFLLAENMPRATSSLDKLVTVTEHLSECDLMDTQVYNGHHWELQEATTALSTWGTIISADSPDMHISQWVKSTYHSAHNKERYRRKILRQQQHVFHHSGLELIDYGHALGERIRQHQNDEPLVEMLKARRIDYRDLEQLWSLSHLQKESMPDLSKRNKQSLYKRLRLL